MREKLLGFIAASILKFLQLTIRYKVYFQREEDAKIFYEYIRAQKPNPNKNLIISFFHQDEMCLIPYFINTGTSVLISISKDGEIMNQAAKKLGYLPVRGSSSKKAISGLIAAIRKTNDGYNCAFAVDGPRGPIYKVKEGVIAVSKKTSTPLVPIRAFCSKQKVFQKSWNQAKLPYPFSTVKIVIGQIRSYQQEELESAMVDINFNEALISYKPNKRIKT